MSISGIDKVEHEEGRRIDDLDWDNLIILDACRYDTYTHVFGETATRITLGSNTREFIQKTFSEGDWSDVVYVTGNPFFKQSFFREETGREVSQVFHEVFHTYETDWNKQYKTVLPESIVRDALTAEKLFPEKKKIIHFMQPHQPFISDPDAGAGFDWLMSDGEEGSVWGKAMKSEISRERAVEGYRQNLRQVEEAVNRISVELNGKTVVTSDHGNLLGENGVYGHPRGLNAKVLREVPWDELS
ncbi:MAG: hypothetical protein ABEJ83_03485 [Candidatus Nanohaloarchaea archaeon]